MKPSAKNNDWNFKGAIPESTHADLAGITATHIKGPLGTLTITLIAMWFLFMLVASLSGVFDSGHRPPIALGTAAVLPVLVFTAGYLKWPAFRRFVLGANLPLLTLAQTWRVGGLIFVILYYKHILPGAFALPAGWGDFAIGATAPLLAWAISSRKRFPKRVFETFSWMRWPRRAAVRSLRWRSRPIPRAAQTLPAGCACNTESQISGLPLARFEPR